MTRRRYTPEEDAAITAMRAAGHNRNTIAVTLGRSRESIISRMAKLRGDPIRDARPKPDTSRRATRTCLRCRENFRSDGPHHRLCEKCVAANARESVFMDDYHVAR